MTVVPPEDPGGAPRLPLIINPTPPLYGVPSVPQIHVAFTGAKTLTPQPSGFTVRLWNLAPTTIDSIAGTVRSIADWRPAAAVVKVDGILSPGGNEITSTLAGMAALRVEAGWSGALAPLFSGTATKVRTYRQGPDRITEITATDGGFNVQAAVANKVFPPATPALAVMTYLAKTLGLTLAPTQGLAAIAGFTLVGGLNCSGDCAKAIADICDALQLLHWYEDGQIWILGDGESLPGQPLVVSPEAIPNAIRLYREAEPLDGQGLRIECALAAGLRPGYLVALASSAQRGTYRVEAVQHQGDNRGGAFASMAVIRSPSPI